MKTIRIIIGVLIAYFLLASCEKANAANQSVAYAFPTNSLGTTANVENYAAKATRVVLIYVWAYKTNGQEAYYGGTTGYIGTNVITSKTQLDQQFIVPGLSIMLHNFCTNADPTWDKSKGVIIYVSCIIDIFVSPNVVYDSQDLLWYDDTIQLVKNSDGSWSVPNLSNFSTQLGDPMPFYIPNLQWARVEIGSNGCSSPFEIDDNQYKPGSSL